jgi:hypothetical protein
MRLYQRESEAWTKDIVREGDELSDELLIREHGMAFSAKLAESWVDEVHAHGGRWVEREPVRRPLSCAIALRSALNAILSRGRDATRQAASDKSPPSLIQADYTMICKT